MDKDDLLIKACTLHRFTSNYTQKGPDDCWLWHGPLTTTGCGRMHGRVKNLRTGVTTLELSAHQFAWVLHHEMRPPQGYVIAHNCGNRLCVNPRHLEALPRSELLKRRWEDHKPDTRKRLTFADAQKIRAQYATEQVGMIALAKRWGVTYLTIHRVLNGTTHPITDKKLAQLEQGIEGEAE